jgi:hypothetical protein
MITATQEGVELLEGGRSVRIACRKCGERIRIEFGDLTRAEAVELVDNLDRQPRECPGYHVELSGWRRLWRLDDAVAAVYGEEDQ